MALDGVSFNVAEQVRDLLAEEIAALRSDLDARTSHTAAWIAPIDLERFADAIEALLNLLGHEFQAGQEISAVSPTASLSGS